MTPVELNFQRSRLSWQWSWVDEENLDLNLLSYKHRARAGRWWRRGTTRWWWASSRSTPGLPTPHHPLQRDNHNTAFKLWEKVVNIYVFNSGITGSDSVKTGFNSRVLLCVLEPIFFCRKGSLFCYPLLTSVCAEVFGTFWKTGKKRKKKQNRFLIEIPRSPIVNLAFFACFCWLNKVMIPNARCIIPRAKTNKQSNHRNATWQQKFSISSSKFFKKNFFCVFLH